MLAGLVVSTGLALGGCPPLALVVLALAEVGRQPAFVDIPGLVFAHLPVLPFGPRLGQAIGQGLDHDRAVVVAGLLLGLGHVLGADAWVAGGSSSC